MKQVRNFRPIVLSRHPSHKILKGKKENRVLNLFPFRSIIRLGSTTNTEKYNLPNKRKIEKEINTVEAIKNSANKLYMKECFTNNNVKTANWWTFDNQKKLFCPEFSNSEKNIYTVDELPYPIVCKRIYGSRNQGNTLINNKEEMYQWMLNNSWNNHIFEKYYSYSREYRIHVSKRGYFYACRKVLKNDTPENQRWFRNDLYCNWIKEDGENPDLFDKPFNWEVIVAECVKALSAVGLDIGACDVRVQSSKKNKKDPKFIIIEINSAPSFGEVTSLKYIQELNNLLLL